MYTAIDCAVQLSKSQYAAIKAAGYSRAFRYYGLSLSKRITAAEVIAAHGAEVLIGVVYEDDPTYPGYFTPAQALKDANEALNQAAQVGQPAGGTIAFACDYDAVEADLAAIADYFQIVHAILKCASMLTAVYGNGLVCSHLSNLGYVHSTWLAESTAWTQSAQYDQSGAWAVKQLRPTYVAGISVDTNSVSDGFTGCW